MGGGASSSTRSGWAELFRPTRRDWIVVGPGSIDVPGLHRLKIPRLAPKCGANLGHPAENHTDPLQHKSLDKTRRGVHSCFPIVAIDYDRLYSEKRKVSE
jgi:hypothetical protein